MSNMREDLEIRIFGTDLFTPVTKSALRAIDKLDGNIKRFNDRVRRDLPGVRNLFLGLTTAAVATTAALYGIAESTADAGDELADLHDRLGIGIEDLSELRFIADQSGVAFTSLSMGIQRMTRRLAEAANGTGEARGAIKELGLDAEYLKNLAPEDQFDAIAIALSGVSNQSERVRLAMKFFDSEGVSILQLLGDTASETERAFEEMRETAHALGVVWTKDSAEAASDYNDEMDRMKLGLVGIKQTIGLELIPVFNEWISEGVEALIRFREEGKVDEYAEDIADGVIYLKEAVEDALPVLRQLVGWTGDAVEGFYALGAGLGIAAAKLAGHDIRTELERLRAELVFLNSHEAFDFFPSGAAQAAEVRRVTEAIRVLEERERQELLTKTELYIAERNRNKEMKDSPQSDDGKAEDIFRITEAMREQQATLDAQLAAEIRLDEYRMAIAAQTLSTGDPFEKLEVLREIGAHETDIANAVADAKIFAENRLEAERIRIRLEGLTDEEAAAEAKVNISQKTFGNLMGLAQAFQGASGKHAKVAFEVMKVLKIREAVLAGKTAVIKAYEWGNSWGGPPGGLAMATIAGFTTAGMILSIKNTKFGGGGSAPSGGGGFSAVGGGTPSPIPTPISQAEAGPKQTIQIIFNGPVSDKETLTQWFDDEIVPRFNDATQNRNVTIIASGLA